MTRNDNPLRSADVRERNAKIVLKLIRNAYPKGLSQAEAVQATGLRAPTMFRIFSSLEAEGVINALPACPEQQEEAKKGRPRMCYGVRPDALYCIGAEFWLDRVSIGIFDFQGELLKSSQDTLTAAIDAQAVVETLWRQTEDLIGAAGIDRSRILGMGVGAPGQVNVRSGSVAFYSRIAGMRGFPLAKALEDKLDLPVQLHNNCSIIALAESRYGELPGAEALFMFLLRSGVNGSFVSEGRAHLASDGNTIETGHVVVQPDGESCVCGARGCLEAQLSHCDQSNLGRGHWLFNGPAAIDNDERCRVYAAAAPYLAAATRTMARLYSPKAFLFVAATRELAEGLSAAVQQDLQAHTSGFDSDATAFYARAYNDALALRGAADLVMDAYFS